MIMARNRCYLPETGHDHEPRPDVSARPLPGRRFRHRGTTRTGGLRHECRAHAVPATWLGHSCSMSERARGQVGCFRGAGVVAGARGAGGAAGRGRGTARRGRGGGTRGGCCCRGGRCRRRRRAWRWPRCRRSCGRGGCRRAGRSRSRPRPGSRCGRQA